jgi:hypothetical protein
MRLSLVIGVLAAALLLAGVIFGRGDPERTAVPAIGLRAESAEVTSREAGERMSERRSRARRNQSAGDGSGGGGASQAPAPPPVPAGDDDDDESDEDDGERDDDGDD